MSKKGETKRQHYVPRLILRNFSADRRRCSMLLLADGRRLDGVSIAKQCYEDYFYGADGELEKSFAEEESRVAGLLSDLSRGHLEQLPVQSLAVLRSFLHYQYARTRGAAEHTARYCEAFVKKAIWGTAELNRSTVVRTEKDLDLVRIRPKQPQDLAIWGAATTRPILFDMAVKFVETSRTPGFVIADHPVVAYNQFAEHRPRLSRYPSITGLAVKGLQLFMPLSPSVTLAVFDPTTYQYGGKSLVCRAGPQDVRFLNQMQALNAWKCLYAAQDRADDGTLRELRAFREGRPLVYDKPVWQSEMIRRGDDEYSQFIVVSYVSVRVGAKLSFIRELDGHAYDDHEGPSVPVRSPELLDIAEAYAKALNDIAREGGERVDSGTGKSEPL